MDTKALVKAGTGENIHSRAEHVYQALVLRPVGAHTAFDIAEAAEVIATLSERLRAAESRMRAWGVE